MSSPGHDPREVFRAAACFEYSGAMLGNYTRNAVEFLARTGRLPSSPAPAPTETQTAGGIFLAPPDAPPITEVTITPGQLIQIPTAIPMFVVQAFATELYLKCLLIRDGKPEKARGHELHKLFGDLDAPRRTRIEQLFNEAAQADAVFQGLQRSEPNQVFTLDFALREMNEVFPDWRYPYESPGPQTSFLGQPWIAVKRQILEIEPTWEAIITNLGKPPTFLPR